MNTTSECVINLTEEEAAALETALADSVPKDDCGIIGIIPDNETKTIVIVPEKENATIRLTRKSAAWLAAMLNQQIRKW